MYLLPWPQGTDQGNISRVSPESGMVVLILSATDMCTPYLCLIYFLDVTLPLVPQWYLCIDC